MKTCAGPGPEYGLAAEEAGVTNRTLVNRVVGMYSPVGHGVPCPCQKPRGQMLPKVLHRRSIRLTDYDYSQSNAYFVTICAAKRSSIFGKVMDEL